MPGLGEGDVGAHLAAVRHRDAFSARGRRSWAGGYLASAQGRAISRATPGMSRPRPSARPRRVLLEVPVQEGDRDPLDDRQLRLLVGVRRQMAGAEQAQEKLGPARGGEEGVGESGLVDGVGGSLDGQQRRARLREGEAAGSRAVPRRRGSPPRARDGRGSSGRRRRPARSRLRRTGRLTAISSRGRWFRPAGCARIGRGRQQARDHEPHVAWLVDQVGLVRAAGSVGVSRAGTPGRRPRNRRCAHARSSARVGARRDREPMAEHDQRKRSRPGASGSRLTRSRSDGGPAVGVADHRHQPPGLGGRPGSRIRRL